ncbi:MAG: hydrolase [Pyrinomonadaceae bacterium]|nr:hydrolase [Pyrinomonadaceae bacterium]MCX7639052.1 hydrolase [Pyrinomonadaceae bacterium]MDW8303727.1 hydrolase [Acidobacteriota bacterium]
MTLLQKEKCALVVVDMQEAFRHVIPDFSKIVSQIAALIEGCKILKVPILLTEQYPKGLGHTVEEIMKVIPEDCPIYEKTSFSCCGAEEFLEKLSSIGANQILVCGIETHICVSQTAHDLIEKGFQVHLIADCVSSRYPENKLIGIEKLKQAGAILSSAEMALFEMMRSSSHPCFKQIQTLVKSL